MSKYLLIPLLTLAVTGSVFAQSLVSTEPANRTAILEEFTGVNCTFCPDGHRIAQALQELHGDDLLTVNIHASNLAVPSGNDLDLRMQEEVDGQLIGDAMFQIFGGTGVPTGAVNRLLDLGEEGLTMNRGAWGPAVEDALTRTTPVNLGMETTYDEATREITIVVELFYTGEAEGDVNNIHVGFLENGVIGPQVDNGVDIPDYEHNHILRHLVTGQLGDPVDLEMGTDFYTRTYTYEVPEDFVIENCEVIAMVAENAANVYTGKKVAATGGTTLITGNLSAISTSTHISTPALAEVSLDYSITNVLEGADDFTVTVSTNGPESWEENLLVNGDPFMDGVANISIPNGETQPISLSITPCVDPGYATYTVSVTNDANPTAPALTETFFVMSGIRDLILSNPGLSEDYEVDYTERLAMTDKTEMAVMNPIDFVSFQEKDQTAGVQNIYYNIGWTFPPFTDAAAEQLTAFLDNGGNLFIAGQDIGWAVNDIEFGPYMTEANTAFYADYMHANFLEDGSPTQSSLEFDSEDMWFGNVGSSAIIDVYGGENQYPELIEPLGDAIPLFTYNDGEDIGGLRVETDNYKLVYLGVNLEQLEDIDVATNIIQAAHDWFYDGIEVTDGLEDCPPEIADGIETIEELNVSLGQNHPNPANQSALIEFNNLEQKATFQLFDFNGRLIQEQNLAPYTEQIKINTATLTPGIYSYRLQTVDGVSVGKKMQVIH